MNAEDLDRLREPLSKFVRGFLHDAHATEDVVQESLLRALRHAGGFRGRAAFRTWVFSIARNLCRDQLRAGRSRLRRFEDLGRRRAMPLADNPLELVEECGRVAAAVSGLAPEARDILYLRAWQGLSYREIARRRGWTPAAVGTRLLRARQGLNERLREGG